MTIRGNVRNALLQLISEEGSQTSFANKIGASKQTVYNWTKGRNTPDIELVAKIADIYSLPLSYFFGTKGVSTENAFTPVPLYGRISAGDPIEMIEDFEMFEVPTPVANKYPQAFLLEVKGESMNKLLPNGCYALIDPCNTVEHQNKPYAICVNEYDATIKRVRKLNNGFELLPDSTDPTFTANLYNHNDPATEAVSIIGRVVYYVLPFDWKF